MKYKDILSKIIIGKKLNKKIITIKLQRGQESCLRVLWKEGYIYGYKKIAVDCCLIFLKYNQKDQYLFNNFFFKDQKLKSANILRLAAKEKNYLYLLISENQIITHKTCNIRGVGGQLFFQT